MATKKEKEIDEIEDDLDEDEDEIEDEKPKKKKAASKKINDEETPEWAKKLISILTPTDQVNPKTIPVPKAPVKEVDQENTTTDQTEEPKPKQSFLSWFW
jgi:hypothetical protein